MVAEAVAGVLSGSLALLADAGHMLTDVASLGIALFAARLSRKPATPRRTYGYHRAEILAAVANAALLLVISGYVLFEAWRRLKEPPEVLSGPMLLIGAGGLAVNIVGLKLLHSDRESSLNIKAAYLEVLGDVLGSIGVLVAGVVIWQTGWTPIDPLVSGGIGLLILPRTWLLLRQAVNILMEGTPAGIDLPALASSINEMPGVLGVHDLHVWTIASGVTALTAHVTVNSPDDGPRVLTSVREILKGRFGINHSTIQIETDEEGEGS